VEMRGKTSKNKNCFCSQPTFIFKMSIVAVSSI
jgi:hypothetical protein